MWLCSKGMHPKDADRLAMNGSVDPDQTATLLIWVYTDQICLYEHFNHYSNVERNVQVFTAITPHEKKQWIQECRTKMEIFFMIIFIMSNNTHVAYLLEYIRTVLMTHEDKHYIYMALQNNTRQLKQYNVELMYMYYLYIWALSSDFVSSSIPSWQILTAHAKTFRGARDLAFCLKVPLDSLLVWTSSGGSGETARMCRLAWTFAAHIGDKYQIRLTRSILCRHHK